MTDLIPTLSSLVSGRMDPADLPLSKWPEVNRLAIRHGLGPLLKWRLDQSGFVGVPPAALDDLDNSARIADFNFQLLKECQLEVQSAFTQVGIDPLWIKGIALAQTVYPYPSLRPMDDLDLFVPPAQKQAALEIARSLGYHPPPKNSLEKHINIDDTPRHHYHLRGGPGGHVVLEIHYRIQNQDDDKTPPMLDWFLQEREWVNLGSQSFHVPTNEAHLLYLCAHAILQHGEAEFRLQRYYDLHLLASLPKLDWNQVVAKADQFGWAYPVWRALQLTRDYFISPIPDDVLSKLENLYPLDSVYARTRKLEGPGHRWEGTLIQFSSLTLKEKLSAFFHLAFPPKAYMRQRYDLQPGKPLLPWYLHRWVDASREVLSSFLRDKRRIDHKESNRLTPLRTLTLPNDAVRDLMQASLDKGTPFHFQALGSSMIPFIRPGERLVITPVKDQPPPIGQVVAFIQPDSGRLLVHRVIARKKMNFLVRGDRNRIADGWVPQTAIIGYAVREGFNKGFEITSQAWFGRLLAILSRLGILVFLLKIHAKLFAQKEQPDSDPV